MRIKFPYLHLASSTDFISLMAHNNPVISKYKHFFSSCCCQLIHQATKQIYKCIKLVSHKQKQLTFGLATAFGLFNSFVPPSSECATKGESRPQGLLLPLPPDHIKHLNQIFHYYISKEPTLPAREGFTFFENTSLSKTVPSLHINMNNSHTENPAKFTGTLSLTLPVKFLRVSLQSNHRKLHQRYTLH